MTGKEIIEHAVCAEMPDMEQLRGNCRLHATKHKQHIKRPARLPAIIIAAAVVICVVLSTLLLPAHTSNSFIVKAYAIDLQTDSNINKSDLLNQQDEWTRGYYIDGVLYIRVRLICEGEDIENVDFIVTEGFFASQRQRIFTDGEGLPMYYDGDGLEPLLVGYGGIDAIGDSVTLNKSSLDDELRLFWGMNNWEWSDLDSIPKEIVIQARATFNDGKTAQQTVTVDLSGPIKIIASTVAE